MPKSRKNLKLKDITFNGYKDFFTSVIFDEGHRVKNVETIQTKLVKGICYNKKYILDLTGTPVLNHVLDIASQLAIIEKIDLFGGYNNFIEKYKDAKKEDLLELQKILKENCYFRREKKDLPELPEKTRQKIIVEISNKDEYETALNDLAYYLREYKQKTDDEIKRSLRGEVMVKIGVLKQISARGKIDAVMENIRDLMEQDEKIVLFGHHHEVLNYFKQNVINSVAITGQENSNQRQFSIDSFQNDVNTKVAICSIQSAGVGLTLTAGRITMFIEMGWHPAIMEQAEDRQHRIGQKKDVHCIYFLGKNTIDEWIYDLIEKKREMSDAITGCSEDIEWAIVESVIDLILQKK
jgi:SWI/SNF-related matrix-associated actin-dependent regulator 1 of chromatin subfamily A